jgi:DNA-binding NarL/FixJ family response regulator
VLVVDDHAPFRALAGELLQSAGYEVIGEAGDGRHAMDVCARLRPDIVLLDVQLPDVDGFAVAALLAAQEGGPVVVLTSTRDAGAYRRRLATSTVRGFIHKPDLSGAALAALLG